MIAIDRIQQLIDAAASAGWKLCRACELSQNEQRQGANLARSDSASEQQGYTHSNGHDDD